MSSKLFFAVLIATTGGIQAQNYQWQQRVEYKMEVDLDVSTHKLKGRQQLTYYNNSPDTLHRVYYHLYFNAFQPGSMMDVRSRDILDPDNRVMDRISKLKENEVGYQRILSLKQEGDDLKYFIHETVMEVILNKKIMPHKKAIFQMQFESQVPVQIRRSGRNNKEGIAYSMTQWYPKIAEYDYQGWHAYPYVGREFFGVWGDYDVRITLDSSFMVAGTGTLQNADDRYGYKSANKRVKKPTRPHTTWHFKAWNVHDFAWAADPDYKHTRVQVSDDFEIHFFYQPSESTTDNWKKLEEYAVKHFQYMNKNYGKYPYPSYSIIQGGDGGMEYPMCTLITGVRKTESLIGVMAHEVSHSWYQGVLGSNESLYPWMDEGFTRFTSGESMSYMLDQPGDTHRGSYANYFRLIEMMRQEPLSIHADHYATNMAYGTAAYSMGDIFLNQLKYLIGEEAFYAGMKRYYNTWKMRHPEPNDFIRVMEKESGLQLHWYLRYWMYSTRHIDYGIDHIVPTADGEGKIMLKRIGDFPMPIDLLVTYRDGKKELFYIPMNETLGSKKIEDHSMQTTIAKTWNWVAPFYSLRIGKPISTIKSVEIDPTQRMADISRDNNKIELEDN